MRSFLAACATASMLLAAAPAGAAVHTVVSGETLSGIAAANGLSSATLAAANGLSPEAFVIEGSSLEIPALGTAPAAEASAPAATTTTSSAAGGGHLVLAGETLSGIAAANRLTTASLAAANGVSPESFAISGTHLRIPAPGTDTASTATPPAATAAPAATNATGGGGHLVAVGETLSGIAAANGLSTGALAAANGLSPTSFVIAGTQLRIPAPGTTTSASPVSAATSGTTGAAPEPVGAYTVQPGDTLSGLALRSRISPEQIAYANGLKPDATLIAGRALKLPTGSPALATTSASSDTPVAPSAPPMATPGRMTSGQIQSIAAEQGVPGSLASAIAWQESGFNNAMVSSASARGVMQVMPGTWDWVQTYLAGGRRLDPASAVDNVRAGTLYLGHLLRETGGDPAMAAAGYYQGLASVRRIGMLPETRRYVANVLALRSRFGG